MTGQDRAENGGIFNISVSGLYLYITSALRNDNFGLYTQTPDPPTWIAILRAGHWRASYQGNDCKFKCMSV